MKIGVLIYFIISPGLNYFVALNNNYSVSAGVQNSRILWSSHAMHGTVECDNQYKMAKDSIC